MNNHKWNIYWLSNPKTVALSNTPDVSTSTQQLKKCEWSLKLHWLECTFLGCIYSNMHKSGFYIHFQMLHPRTLTNSSNFPGWGYTLIARWVSWLASPTIFRNIDAESVLRPSFVTGVKTRKSLIQLTTYRGLEKSALDWIIRKKRNKIEIFCRSFVSPGSSSSVN